MHLLEAPRIAAIAGENSVPISQLPIVWQEIATGKVSVGLPDSQSYVEMAQLFQYKLAHGDVDLFKERPELAELKPSSKASAVDSQFYLDSMV